MNQLLQAALGYARLGFRIFPCAPRQKVPLTSHGVKDATTDERTITEWWTAKPDANIAVACGAISGIHVCDIDVDEKKSGWESLSNAGIVMPDTIMQRTPTGGAHLFYQTDDPPANKNSFLPGIDIRSTGYYVVLAPSIHPNGGVYAWEPGHAPGELEASLWPSSLRPIKVPIRAPESIQGDLERPNIHQDDTIRRASAYLAMCDPAVQGLGGHDKLLWAAVCMTHGFRLPDEETFRLLASEFNPRCSPPWELDQKKDLNDFRRKVAEARKLVPKFAEGWLLDDGLDNSLPSMSSNQAMALIENSYKGNKAYRELTKPRAVEPEAESKDYSSNLEWQFLTQPTGLLGRICSWLNKTAIREQPMLSLGSSLSFCGVLFGRKIKDEWGLRTNLYCMGVGESSCGKNHSLSQLRCLCDRACCTDLLGGDDFASDAAIESRLERFPATLFLLDEIGHLMQHAKYGGNKYLAKVVPLLMKLYSSAGGIYLGREYAEEDKQRTIAQPCCCIWGTTTPVGFLSGLSSSDVENGWLSRCLVFPANERPVKNRSIVDREPPSNMVEAVAEWFFRKISLDKEINAEAGISDFLVQRFGNNSKVPPEQIVIPTANEANEIFRAFDLKSESSAKEFPEAKNLWFKAEENARKIALIVAASEDSSSPVITVSVADYSCRLVEFLLRDFCVVAKDGISDNLLEQKKLKILAIIRHCGVNGCAKNTLTRKTQMFNKTERDACLQDLHDAGLIYVEIAGKGLIMWTEENFAKRTGGSVAP